MSKHTRITTQRRWFGALVKKILKIQSPGIVWMTDGEYKYRYDWYRALKRKVRDKSAES